MFAGYEIKRPRIPVCYAGRVRSRSPNGGRSHVQSFAPRTKRRCDDSARSESTSAFRMSAAVLRERVTRGSHRTKRPLKKHNEPTRSTLQYEYRYAQGTIGWTMSSVNFGSCSTCEAT